MSKKRRIFIALHYLELGGVETSLIGLLHALDYSHYEVDVFLYRHSGELLPHVPKLARLLPERSVYAHLEQPIITTLLHGHLRLALARLRAKWRFHRYVQRTAPKDGSAIFGFVGAETVKVLPTLEDLGLYDLAVSFLTPHNIVLHKVQARRKVAWIHTDYSRIDVNVDLELPVWSAYDAIASISPSATKAFLMRFPTLQPKVVEIENILPTSLIHAQLQAVNNENVLKEMPCPTGAWRLLSIGRFCEAKNFDNIPAICHRLWEMGLSVHWFLVGYGEGEALIRQRIKEEGMEGKVIVLGKRTNPYPYIAACDIYIQPSRYEGKSVTVREAQLLCKPVVITNYATASSQIEDGVDGIIVPMDNEGCAQGIARYLRNTSLRQRHIAHLQTHDYSGREEVQKIIRLMSN